MLIREAFLRGISTRQVGRVVATLTGEVVSAQTVSKLTRDLDEAVRQFHQATLSDDYAYLFLDGVSLRVRRPSGPQAGTNAGGLWSAARRHAPFAGFPAQPGRKSGGLGGACCKICTGADWKASTWTLIHHRRLPRFGGGHSDGLSPGAASALLGPQDAQYFGESTEARLR